MSVSAFLLALVDELVDFVEEPDFDDGSPITAFMYLDK